MEEHKEDWFDSLFTSTTSENNCSHIDMLVDDASLLSNDSAITETTSSCSTNDLSLNDLLDKTMKCMNSSDGKFSNEIMNKLSSIVDYCKTHINDNAVMMNSNDSHYTQMNNNFSEEALCLDNNFGNDNGDELYIDPCYESCGTNMQGKENSSKDEPI